MVVDDPAHIVALAQIRFPEPGIQRFQFVAVGVVNVEPECVVVSLVQFIECRIQSLMTVLSAESVKGKRGNARFTRLKWLEHGNVLDPYEVVKVPLNEVVRVLWLEMIETIKKSPLIMNVENRGVLNTQPGRKLSKNKKSPAWINDLAGLADC